MIEFNKRVFALLLDKARGTRTWYKYAQEAEVSYVQMRKLASESQANAPRAKLIKQVADKSQCEEVGLAELMFAAGYVKSIDKAERNNPNTVLMAKIMSLSSKQKTLLEEFVEFLCQKNKEEHGDEASLPVIKPDDDEDEGNDVFDGVFPK